MTILNTIVDSKLEELEKAKVEKPFDELEKAIKLMPSPRNLSGSLMGGSIRLLAETKKASPSKGLLRSNYDPVVLARSYADNGAAAISVLTETAHFQGSLDHMAAVKKSLSDKKLPVLRKDFVFEEYQVYEARAYGADAILLIVAILSPDLLSELLKQCQKLWVQALVEVHDESELEIALIAGAEIIGINNRDLRTFQTDISVTEKLAPMVPSGKIIISESGIHSREDIIRLGNIGVDAVLIGEALVTSDNPGNKVAELLKGI